MKWQGLRVRSYDPFEQPTAIFSYDSWTQVVTRVERHPRATILHSQLGPAMYVGDETVRWGPFQLDLYDEATQQYRFVASMAQRPWQVELVNCHQPMSQLSPAMQAGLLFMLYYTTTLAEARKYDLLARRASPMEQGQPSLRAAVARRRGIIALRRKSLPNMHSALHVPFNTGRWSK